MVWGMTQLVQQGPFSKVTCANRVTDQILCKMRYSQETCSPGGRFQFTPDLAPPGLT